jgi:hypothetical protein
MLKKDNKEIFEVEVELRKQISQIADVHFPRLKIVKMHSITIIPYSLGNLKTD